MAKQKGEKGAGVDLTVLLLATVGFSVLCWIMWFAFHNFITWLALRTRQWELLALGTLVKPFVGDNNMLRFGEFYAQSSSVNLTFGSFLQIMKESGKYVVFIYCPILLGAGVYLWRMSPTENYKKQHTMDSLSKQESELWPEIKPPLMQRLDKGDIEQGPWRVSLTEQGFAKKYNLYKDKEGEPDPYEDEETLLTLDHNKTRALFVEQLGVRWTGYHNLPPYMKGVFAAFSVRVNSINISNADVKAAARAECESLFRKMAVDFTVCKGDVSKMDFSWADEIYEKSKAGQYLEIAIERHAYVYTLMPTMLQLCRTDGVLASSLFTWLRPVDRRLWYILENAGGRCFSPECAGISAHWLAEKEIGAKLLFPVVQEAVIGLSKSLELYMDEDGLKLDMFK